MQGDKDNLVTQMIDTTDGKDAKRASIVDPRKSILSQLLYKESFKSDDEKEAKGPVITKANAETQTDAQEEEEAEESAVIVQGPPTRDTIVMLRVTSAMRNLYDELQKLRDDVNITRAVMQEGANIAMQEGANINENMATSSEAENEEPEGNEEQPEGDDEVQENQEQEMIVDQHEQEENPEGQNAFGAQETTTEPFTKASTKVQVTLTDVWNVGSQDGNKSQTRTEGTATVM